MRVIVFHLLVIAILSASLGCSRPKTTAPPLSNAAAYRIAEAHFQSMAARNSQISEYRLEKSVYNAPTQSWVFFYSRVKPGETVIHFDHSSFGISVFPDGKVFDVWE